jgi:ABC-2 type transport system ATP-binding protein
MTAMLRLRGLGKDYGARTAVATIDLEVRRGECLGLLGPNGAGKTTTISMAAGVVTPSRGAVEIDGIDLARRPREAKAKLGLVPQDLAIYEELTCVQNLRYFGALYGLTGAALADQIDWALGVVGLGERRGEPVKQFSGGMKRRLNLAAGLIHRPQLVILDEPTVGVDPQSRNHIFETVRQLHHGGMTVVYTSHYMEEVEALCDRVAIVDAGAIVALGRIAELVAQHAGKGLELELAGAAEAIDGAERAAAAHGVVARDGHVLRVVPTDGLAPLVAAIEGAGATIARVESREANLETAFLALTGRALRDAA